jgi:hypothetical protein
MHGTKRSKSGDENARNRYAIRIEQSATLNINRLLLHRCGDGIRPIFRDFLRVRGKQSTREHCLRGRWHQGLQHRINVPEPMPRAHAISAFGARMTLHS